MKTDIKWHDHVIDDMLVKYVTSKVDIYTAVVVLYDETAIGISFCHPDDVFDLDKGISLALDTAMDLEVTCKREITYHGNRRIIDYINELSILSPKSVPHSVRKWLRAALREAHEDSHWRILYKKLFPKTVMTGSATTVLNGMTIIDETHKFVENK